MEALLFGESARLLSGVYQEPVHPDRGVAVLICPPWDREQLRSYRAMIMLADALARKGCASMRFDYAGSGNSPGGTEAMSAEGWLQDVRTAAEELQAMSGARRLSLCGLRLGALLAANAGCPNVDTLYLWEPVSDANGYFTALEQSDRSEWAAKNRYRSRRHRIVPRPEQALLGYRYRPEWRSGIEALDYASRCGNRTVVGAYDSAHWAQHPALASAEIHALPGRPRIWRDPQEDRRLYLPSEAVEQIASALVNSPGHGQ